MSSVAVALSGGVDSSVAALLLKKAGHEVVGITFKNFDLNDMAKDPSPRNCCSIEHLNNARAVCDSLEIPHYVINRVEQFARDVLSNFRQSYLQGLTPNPCVRCNSLVRWPEMIHLADDLNLDYIATGHYARIVKYHDNFAISRSDNSAKDQSYALWGVKQEYLARTLMPLGELTKSQVREIAADNGLINASMPESQDICFVPEGKYFDMLELTSPGPIVNLEGTVLGEHKGISHYTIGQRQGLGISHPEPLYVLKIDVENNKLVVGTEQFIFRTSFDIRCSNWFIKLSEGDEIACMAKIRYRHQAASCRVKIEPDGRASVNFLDPQRAITPGQSAVFYDEQTLLGGGIIEVVHEQEEPLFG